MALRIILLLTVLVGCGGGVAAPGPEPEPMRHLIYLHGRIIEDQGPRPTHPSFGVYEYQEILDTFSEAGFEVSSDQRPARSRVVDAARTTAAEVRQLLDAGVPASDITVVGFSKGGAIAIQAALELENPRVNYVFIACCGPWIEGLFTDPGLGIRGRMLSIHEASDTTGPCRDLFAHASADSTTAELELHIGGGHGAFFRPHPEWVDPVVRWARGDDPEPDRTSR